MGQRHFYGWESMDFKLYRVTIKCKHINLIFIQFKSVLDVQIDPIL